jgi:hypothetical protein
MVFSVATKSSFGVAFSVSCDHRMEVRPSVLREKAKIVQCGDSGHGVRAIL